MTRPSRVALPIAGVALVAALVVACAGSAPRGVAPANGFRRASSSDAVRFRYRMVGSPNVIDDQQLFGRPTVIAFVTTFDLASQAQVRFIAGVLKRRAPRINAVAVVLEPINNAPVVEGFTEALRLPYPVAWGDDDTFAGRGPFADVRAVPTIVVLDAKGRLAWKHVGLAREDEIIASLDRL